MKKILFLVLFLLTACSSGDQSAAAPATATVPPQPTTTALPTPSSPGDPVVWRDLQVNMDQAEITDRFISDFGAQSVPS